MAETWVRWKVWLIWRAYIYIEIAVAAAMEEFGGKFWCQRKKKKWGSGSAGGETDVVF